jgi:hypothetical protein
MLQYLSVCQLLSPSSSPTHRYQESETSCNQDAPLSIGALSKTMPRSSEGRTYRVRQLLVSPNTSFDELSSTIARVNTGLGPAENIQVHSIASSFCAFHNPPTSEATVTFSKTPPVLNNDENEWSLSARHLGWGRRNVIFDTHFLGFTVLNEPDHTHHTLEYVPHIY